ncbi:MAG: cadherin domain-containing protein, partial [Planctomycetaceae bacterium]|nr:cadherin domain-containing protein [Planctomycetaceae bacterium]
AIGAASDYGQSVQVQSDGKIVVGGYADIGGVWEFALTRYNSDGTLDASFGGGDGIVTTDVGPGFDSGRSLTIQSDGKILLAGISSNGSNDDFALVRYNSDGTLDTTFDLTNKLDGTPTFTEGGSAVVLDADIDVRDSELDAFNSGNGNYSGSSLTIVRNGGASTEDVLSFNDGNGITLSGGNLIKNSQVIATFDITSTAGELVITFTDANGEIPTSADVDNTLRQITYANSSDAPTASVQLDWTFDDGNTGAQGSGGALQALGSVTVNITAVNDSPVLSGSNALTSIAEDDVSNGGTLVSTLVSGQIVDADGGTPQGIAVIAVVTTNGTWEYTTDGSNWFSLASVSDAAARLLAADATTAVRFVPNANYNGTVSNGLTFRAWDQSAGSNGATVDVAGDSIRDNFATVAYSNSDGTVNWNSDWVETDNNGGGASGGFIRVNSGVLEVESDRANDNVYREVNLSGVDAAILTLDYQSLLSSGDGDRVELQVSGNGGGSYTTLSTFTGSALTGSGSLTHDLSGFISGNTRIRFIVTNVDKTKGVDFDNVQIAFNTAVGGTSAYSVATAASSIAVTPVNDAPVLDNTGSMSLSSITEDDISNAGNTVAEVISSAGGDRITDIDTAALEGIAIRTTTENLGTWQYSLDGGSNWSNVGAVTNSSALLLRATDRLRFIPSTDLGGSDSFTFRAWDQTSGTAGTKATTANHGSAFAFSIDIQTVTVTVTDVNDAPVFTALNNTPTFTEGGSAVVLDADVTVSDPELAAVDNYNGAFLWLHRTGGGNSDDVFGATGTLAAFVQGGNITLSGNNIGTVSSTSSGNLILTFNSSATQADVNSVLQQLTYSNSSQAPPASVSLTWEFYDGNSGGQGTGGQLTAVASTSVNITAANDDPIITSGGGGASLSISVAENTTNAYNVTSTDMDGGTPVYSISGGVDQALFAIDSVTGILSFVTAPDYEAPADAGGDNVYDVILQVSDGAGGTDTQTLIITVVDINEGLAFVDAVDDSFNVNRNTASVLDVSANDLDNFPDTKQVLDLTQGTHGTVTNNNDGTVTYTPDTNFTGNDSFQYLSVDSGTALAHYWNLNGNANDSVGGMNGTLTGTTTTSGQFGTALNFNESSDHVVFGDVSYASDFTISFDFRIPDNNGSSVQYLYSHGDPFGTNSVTVVISEAFSSYPHQLRTEIRDANDTLDDIGLDIDIQSIIGDGQWHNYSVTVSSTTGIAVYLDGVLSSSDAARGTDGVNPTGSAYLGARYDLNASRFFGGGLDNVMVFDRALSSGEVTTLGTHENQATASVFVNNQPVITSSNSVSVPENTTSAITVTATDADVGQTLSYSITGGNDQSKFAINSSSGALSLIAAPNFESPTDANSDNVYEVQVTVSDGFGGTDVQSISVTVTDVNEFNVSIPTDADATANSVAENSVAGTTVGVTVSAQDGDASNNTVTYSLDNSAGGRFAVNSSSGVVTVAGSLDRETAASYDITVRATSSDGSSATATFTIAITDVNEFGVGTVVDNDPSANSVAENAAIGATVGIVALATDADATTSGITYTLDDDAGGLFMINSATGQVQANGALDYETATSHTITARATSADLSFSTQSFTINVTDVSESPVSAISDTDGTANTVAENSSNGTAVGITAFATDPDGTDTVSYTLDDSAGGRFAINLTSGVVTVAGPIDREAAASYDIVVRATSTDLSFTTATYTITITDVNDNAVSPPTDADGLADSVAENAATGTAVGITAASSDADVINNTVTYQLIDSAGGRFQIDANTGAITVLNGSLLDRETAASWTVTVQADGSDGSNATANFVISLVDVDEFDVSAPTDTDATANTIDENAANGTTVGITASATDDDATTNTVTYSLTDDAGGRFAVNSGTGVVTVANGTLLDRETNASHNITVRATSVDGSTNDTVFTINVNDVDEFDVSAPVDTDAIANAVDENAANGTTVGITGFATDDDATTNTVTYSLTDDAGGRFAINSGTGVVTVANGILLDREANASHSITVRATSADGSTNDTVFTISVNDLDEFDVGAVTDVDGTANTVAEDAVAGATVGITASATDDDATTNTITYTLDDDAGGRFAINSSTGVVTVNAALDYETATSHNVTVRATSVDGSFSTQLFSISVTDVNENGVSAISDTDATLNTVAENAANGTTVGVTAFASDSDGTDSVSYSLDDNAGGRFTIDSVTGVVIVAGAIDREAAASYDIVV